MTELSGLQQPAIMQKVHWGCFSKVPFNNIHQQPLLFFFSPKKYSMVKLKSDHSLSIPAIGLCLYSFSSTDLQHNSLPVECSFSLTSVRLRAQCHSHPSIHPAQKRVQKEKQHIQWRKCTASKKNECQETLFAHDGGLRVSLKGTERERERGKIIKQK